MTTPTKHLEIFDEKFSHIDHLGFRRMNHFVATHRDMSDAYYGDEIIEHVKQYLIQTVISVLEENIKEVESEINKWNSNGEYYTNVTEALQNVKDSLTTTLSTWKALL